MMFGGLDGFIRRDHHEVFDSEFGGDRRQVIRAEDVILDGFEGVRLHQGHMFVSRGVVDDGWCMKVKDIPQALPILNAADLRVKFEFRELLPDFVFQMKQRRFGYLICDQGGRLESADLPAQFRADGSGGAGDAESPGVRFWPGFRIHRGGPDCGPKGLRPRRPGFVKPGHWTRWPQPGWGPF